MKLVVKSSFFTLGGALLFTSIPTQAQTSPAPRTPENALPAASEVSLTALVQMQNSQIERLNRLFTEFSTRHRQQENQLARLQSQLRQAQSPASLDEKKVARLLRDMNQVQRKATDEFLSVRVKALQVLQPVQRAQLESVATDPRFRLRRDAYYQLLLLPVEQIWSPDFSANGPNRQVIQNTSRSAETRAPGSGNYGVYGGYGYGGPQYGVYGGYGQGGVGVYGGLGRGGPSIGIGIGGLFGGRGRRW